MTVTRTRPDRLGLNPTVAPQRVNGQDQRIVKATKKKVATATTCGSKGPKGPEEPKKEKSYSKLTIKDVLGMIFKDRVLWIVTGFVALSVFAAIASNPITLAASGVGIGIIAILAFMNKKEITYQMSANLSLFKNKFNLLKYTWFEKADKHVYLGALPLKNHDHINKFKKDLNIGTVICMTDKFELKERTITQRPVTPEEWDNAGVTFKHFPTTDFVPVPILVIHEAASYINDTIIRTEKSGSTKKIYIHCKAGVGRTPTVYAGYLLRYKDFSAEEALKYVKKVRPSTNMSKKQKARIHEYGAYLKGIEAGRAT